MKTADQTTKLIRSIGLAFCVVFLLSLCWVWRACIEMDYGPTGIWKDLTNPSSIWFCLFVDIAIFLPIILMTFLTLYHVLNYSGD
jgi:hypothetical protein